MTVLMELHAICTLGTTWAAARVRKALRISGGVALSFSVLLASASARGADWTPPLQLAAHGNALRALLLLSASPGQTATELADGGWLLLGGFGDPDTGAARRLDRQGRVLPVAVPGLSVPRVDHTATLLPSGKVLILGGVDASGIAVDTVEEFDPYTNRIETIPNAGFITRSAHSATVLADGRILIAGGRDRQGRAVHEAEVYDAVARSLEHISPRLEAARYGHLAALVPGSNVLVWGGTGVGEQALHSIELFEREEDRFRTVAEDEAERLAGLLDGNLQPSIESSIPAAGAADIPPLAMISIRFNQSMVGLGHDTVTLTGPAGPVPSKIVVLEHGLVVFVTPLQALQPASTYSLLVRGARSKSGRPLDAASIQFSTAGLPAAAGPTLVTGMNTDDMGSTAHVPASTSAVGGQLPAGQHPGTKGGVSHLEPSLVEPVGTGTSNGLNTASTIGLCAPDVPPEEGPPPESCEAGDPVDCYTGLFIHDVSDLEIPDVIPIEVRRTYRPRDSAWRGFGVGANVSYDFFLVGDSKTHSYIDLVRADGGRVKFVRTSSGTGAAGAVFAPVASPGFNGAMIASNPASDSCFWEMRMKDGAKICFAAAALAGNSRQAAARSISDRFGNTVVLTRDVHGRLERVTSPSGRFIEFEYDYYSVITRARDNLGRTVSYIYDNSGRLVRAVDPMGNAETYTYDARGNMLTVHDRRGNRMVANEFSEGNRVVKQTYADGSVNLFSYSFDASKRLVSTDVTNALGIVTRMNFDQNGYVSKVTRALGLSEQQVVMVERDRATNLVLGKVDAAGRKTAFSYDAKGNLLTQTVLAETASAATISFDYTPDTSQIRAMTDELGNRWSLEHDGNGRVVRMSDPNGHTVSRSYNAAGLIDRLIDARGNSILLEYAGNDVSQVTDEIGRKTATQVDAYGREYFSDTAGRSMLSERDLMGRVTRLTDPGNYSVASQFDAHGNETNIQTPAAATIRILMIDVTA